MCVVCVCMIVRDMLRCDSVTGARWFPKQSVSLTEGLFVKENTGMNLSMSGERGGRGGREEEWRGVQSRLKSPA